jgi:hypothetical protein
VAADHGAAYVDVSTAALEFARAALLVGLLYAANNVYWGLGGTRCLNTFGGPPPTRGRASTLANGKSRALQ